MPLMTAADVTRTADTTVSEWRFTEFVMRTWTEPELADRYRQDPAGTLAEHGIHLREGDQAPRLDAGAAPVVIEHLGRPAPDAAPWPCCIA